MAGMFEIMKNLTQHIEEMAAAYYKKTNVDPDKFKMVQRVTYGGEDIVLRLDTWFEPLGVEEIDIYRKRAEAAESEVARLREATRWIPVSERLPQPGEWVMISEKSGGISNSFVDFEDYETRTGIEWFGADDVTHWMPLPKPPEAA